MVIEDYPYLRQSVESDCYDVISLTTISSVVVACMAQISNRLTRTRLCIMRVIVLKVVFVLSLIHI